ncbi:PEGA domain-containing protein [Pseudomaricurvus alkylphenolicus]|uniref:PEGA domain-containing protein n=1 Tax=Pseudomaricurvus alkylphenolicus TaxID=1306991 RepID=UPI00141F9401|nr:PEGA domain-containing protein [Pseudomaricurvus alkylphenolicus]NIB39828.1 PEGA domain-containing protein [Pseudomaricurvus alkylphenolicus]
MTQQEEIPAITTQDDDIIQPTAFQPATAESEKTRSRLNPVNAAIGTLLVLALMVMAYLFSAKSLYIRLHDQPPQGQIVPLAFGVDFSGNNVSVDGLLTLTIGDHFLLLPGQRQLSVTVAGYKPLNTTIEVNTEDTQYLDFTLARLPGALTINSNTPGQVLINGKAVGDSDQKIEPIDAGVHELTLEADRYQTVQQQIVIEGRRQHQQLSIELQPNWATITLTSNPEGATLTVGGKAVGTTPMSTELLAGKHELEVGMNGFKSWRQNLRVEALQDQDLPLITLKPLDARLNVTSSPSGASVTVDGTYRGQTPLLLALAPGKNASLTLFKDGYQPHHRTLSMQNDSQRSLSVKLQPTLGDIRIQAQPAQALLYVDDRLMGRANQSLTLPARQHKIRISHEGYADHETTILPRPDLAQTLTIALLTLDQQRWIDTPKQITSKAGQSLKLFRPNDTFTMGASRRQQGRRANESQRTVKLDRAFYLSTQLVTNEQYRRFDRFHSSGHVKGNSLNGEKYPVVGISWQQAAAYCNWLSEQEKLTPYYIVEDGVITGFDINSTGYRLPTEAEWAWAARLKNGAMQKYAWGTQLPPDEGSGNFGDRRAAALLGAILTNYDDGYPVTSPIGKFAANHRDLYDLSGNAAEWIGDYYGIKTGLSLKAELNPTGPEQGDFHVIRGSSWAHATMTDLRLSFRDYGSDGRNDVSFRVARYVRENQSEEPAP